MTSETKLPDGLQLAIDALEPLDEESAFESWLEFERPHGDVEAVQRQWENSTRLKWLLEAQTAASAIRAEHAKRVTLQHHAADQAQRIAELEAERDKAHQDAISMAVERDELRARLEDLEAQEPVAWQARFSSDGGWDFCSQKHHELVSEETDGCFARDGYEVRQLYARPIPSGNPDTLRVVMDREHGGLSFLVADELIAAPEHKA